MTDAKALHRDLMNALLPHIPRTVYQDIRRVVTLAWAIVGLWLTRTVRLTAWAEAERVNTFWTDATTNSGAFVAAATPGVSCPGWPPAPPASRGRCGG